MSKWLEVVDRVLWSPVVTAVLGVAALIWAVVGISAAIRGDWTAAFYNLFWVALFAIPLIPLKRRRGRGGPAFEAMTKKLLDANPWGVLRYSDGREPMSAPTSIGEPQGMREREIHGPVTGVCVVWDNNEGWGAVASPGVEGEVWAHYSDIEGTGYKSLRAGQPVTFTYETPDFLQDGYPHRAIRVQPG